MVISKLPALVGKLAKDTNKKYTQQELADLIGIKRQTVNKWMQSKDMKSLDPDTILAIKRFFNVKYEDVFEIVPMGKSSTDAS